MRLWQKNNRGRTNSMLCGAALLAVLGLVIPSVMAAAGRTRILSGGGQGTYGQDLDGNGTIDGTYFGLGVTIDSRGEVSGHFVCAMWGNTKYLELTIMGVEGMVTSALVSRSGAVTLSGIGSVDLGASGFFTNVPFQATITPGGPSVGTLQLSVIGILDGIPGDPIPGNGNCDLPLEIVTSGIIQLN